MLMKTLAVVAGMLTMACSGMSQSRITFPSEDGVTCTADLYMASRDPATPFIVLFHQAGNSRGEYLDIAPRLNRLGFNCLAVDARSGGEAKGVKNATYAAAETAGKPTYRYVDALPDLSAALKHARLTYAKGKLIAWGSSYSASLCLHLAASQPGLMDGVLAFSPGEYFPKVPWIAEETARITTMPAFITSGPREEALWKRLYEAMPSPKKASYLPSGTADLHGSRVLWADLGSASYPIPNPLAEGYWMATEAFLKKHFVP